MGIAKCIVLYVQEVVTNLPYRTDSMFGGVQEDAVQNELEDPAAENTEEDKPKVTTNRYYVFLILPQIYTANHTTFPLQMYAITV